MSKTNASTAVTAATEAKPVKATVSADSKPREVVAKPVKAVASPLTGTPAALIAQGVTLNGKALDMSVFSVLRKYHYKTAIDTAGYVEKPQGQKGKAAEIVSLHNVPGFEFAASVQVA